MIEQQPVIEDKEELEEKIYCAFCQETLSDFEEQPFGKFFYA